MEFYNVMTSLFLILALFITLSSSSASGEDSSSSKNLGVIIIEAQVPSQRELDLFGSFSPKENEKEGSKNKSEKNENLNVKEEGIKEKSSTKSTTTRLEGLQVDHDDDVKDNVEKVSTITADLIHEFLTSTLLQLEQLQDGDEHDSANNNNNMQINGTTKRVRRGTSIDIKMGAANPSFLASNPSASPARFVQGSGETDSNFMMVPQEMLKQSFDIAETTWQNRQRTIENMWMSSGGGSDPKSPIGTAYAFSAPNQKALAMADSSALLEIASRAFLKSMNSGGATRQKRQVNSVFNGEQSMAESMMHVNVNSFIKKPDMPNGNCGKTEPETCDPTSPHRSYSGVCNNLKNPSWGRSVVTLDRMLPPVYSDGISAPRMHSVTGELLPSPRYVSSTVHIDVSHLSQKHTLLLMQYGQFLDHDMTFTPVHRGPNGILNCRDCASSKETHPECWPIQVPFGDIYYPARQPNGKPYCIPFTRSLPGQQRLGPREQINQNSAYIDSSQIYGDSICKANGLRGGNGYLNATFHPSGKVLLPQINSIDMCKSKSGFCFHAGDSRASEQPALAALHTIFLREHNRLVDGLHRINPQWSEEKLYHQSRRILSAANQHITFNEFLPRILGPTMMNTYELRLEQSYYYNQYDPTCQAATYNEFATSAFRFGHSLIRAQLPRMNDNYHGMSPTIPLRDGFFNSDMLIKPLMIDEIVRGLLAEPMEQLDPFVTNEITNHLFEDKTKAFSGMDLISLNIHRGRDHGLQGYNAYRVACSLKKAYTFDDLASEIPLDVIERLKLVYSHVDDIDLFTGSLTERPVSGGLVGPTTACIIGHQFQRLRKCDRFWYETNDPLIQFSPTQLAEIRKITLAKIVCENFDIPSDIQKYAFDAPHNVLNPRMPCGRLGTLNFEAWRDTTPIIIPPPQPAAYLAPPPQQLAPQPATYLAPPPPPIVCNIGQQSVPIGGSAMSSPCVQCVCTPEGTKCASLRITNCGSLLRQYRWEDILSDNICATQCSYALHTGTAFTTRKSHSRFSTIFKNSLFGNNIFRFF